MQTPDAGPRGDTRDPVVDLHQHDARIKWIAFSIALAIHVVALTVNFPDFDRALGPGTPEHVIVVRRYVPPPPQLERPHTAKKEFTRKIPIPDPTPSEPEPIREPAPQIVPEPYPEDALILIGVPAPPSVGRGIRDEPLLPGIGGVTLPVRIEDTYVRPKYPEVARVARIEGRVILRAVVLRDGSVDDLSVLACNHPQLGFEEEAIQAVRQWRYKPALQDGRPVDVYFTVLVDFELL